MSTIKCGNCGEAYSFEKNEEGKSIKCDSCREPLTFVTPRQVSLINPVQRVKQQAFTLQAIQTETNSSNKSMFYVSLAMIAISGKAWENAVDYLEKAKTENPANAEINYYLCFAMLGGKAPRVHKQTAITSIIDNINCAIAFDPKGKYYYLKALIIYNHFTERCMSYSEKFSDILDLAYAFGVTEEDEDEIFSLVPVSKPAKF